MTSHLQLRAETQTNVETLWRSFASQLKRATSFKVTFTPFHPLIARIPFPFHTMRSLLFSLLSVSATGLPQLQQTFSLPTISIPLLGFGTWNLEKSNTSEIVSTAIQTGYRHIDGAAAYGNEVAVGKGIKDGIEKAGISRGDIWVTSKLPNGA